jgi:uncharacterized protein
VGTKQVIEQVYEAIAKQDVPALMDLLHDDVRWTIDVADPGGAPWWGDFRGKQEIGGFFGGLTAVEWTDFSVKELIAEGDLAMALLHAAFRTKTGKETSYLEVHVWRLRDGKVASLDAVEDTAQVKEALRA